MTRDPTTADVIAQAIDNETSSLTTLDAAWLEKVTAAVAADLCLDPDAPASLLHWHATTAERRRCLAICEEEAFYPEAPRTADKIAHRIARRIEQP